MKKLVYGKKLYQSQIKMRNGNPDKVETALMKRVASKVEDTSAWDDDSKLDSFIDGLTDAEQDAMDYAKKRGADSEW